MTTNEIKVGTKVVKDGYKGTVIEVCSWNTSLVVVRLQSGTVCVSKSNFSGQYANNYVVNA